jgi:hypothetical protein
MLTATKTNVIARRFARRAAVKVQILTTFSCCLPGASERQREIIETAFDQDAFWRLDLVGRKDDERKVLLRMELDYDRHREQVLLHPTIKVGKHWKRGLVPELSVIVRCFREVVSTCNLRVGYVMLLRDDVPSLEVNGVTVTRPLSEFKENWIVGWQGPLSHLDELSVLYAFASDLTAEA